MADRVDKLEEGILTLFRSACRQGRLDVAEHLLRALETSNEKKSRDARASDRDALARAYIAVARLPPQRRRS